MAKPLCTRNATLSDKGYQLTENVNVPNVKTRIAGKVNVNVEFAMAKIVRSLIVNVVNVQIVQRKSVNVANVNIALKQIANAEYAPVRIVKKSNVNAEFAPVEIVLNPNVNVANVMVKSVRSKSANVVFALERIVKSQNASVVNAQIVTCVESRNVNAEPVSVEKQIASVLNVQPVRKVYVYIRNVITAKNGCVMMINVLVVKVRVGNAIENHLAVNAKAVGIKDVRNVNVNQVTVMEAILVAVTLP